MAPRRMTRKSRGATPTSPMELRRSRSPDRNIIQSATSSLTEDVQMASPVPTSNVLPLPTSVKKGSTDFQEKINRTPPPTGLQEACADFNVLQRGAQEVIVELMNSTYFKTTDAVFSSIASNLREKIVEKAYAKISEYFIERMDSPLFNYLSWLLPMTSELSEECARPHSHVLPSIVKQRWNIAVENLVEVLPESPVVKKILIVEEEDVPMTEAFNRSVSAASTQLGMVTLKPRTLEEQYLQRQEKVKLISKARSLEGEVPKEIKIRLSKMEYTHFQMMYGKDLINDAVWPLKAFLPLYFESGENEILKRWVEEVAKTPERINEFTKAVVPLVPEIITEPEILGQALVPRMRGLPCQFAIARPNDMTPSGNLTFQTLFPSIDATKAAKFWTTIPKYDQSNSINDMNDYCTWYSTVQNHITSAEPDMANYSLLHIVPLHARNTAFKVFGDGLPRMNTDALATAVGSFVYKEEKKNVYLVASDVRPGRYMCHSRNDVYKRAMDIYRCQYEIEPPHIYCSEAYLILGWHMAGRRKHEFQATCINVYPTLKFAHDRDRFLAATDSPLPAGKHLPITTEGIFAFIEWIVQEAGARTMDEEEAAVFRKINGPEANPRGRFGLSNPSLLREGPRPTRPYQISNARKPEYTTNINAISAPVQENQSADIYLANAPSAATAPQNAQRPPVDRRNIICNHCGKPRHFARECFLLHPNLRPQGNSNGNQRPGNPNRPWRAQRPQLNCSHCHKGGHTQEKCWLLHPEMKQEQRRKFNQGQGGNPNNIVIVQPSNPAATLPALTNAPNPTTNNEIAQKPREFDNNNSGRPPMSYRARQHILSVESVPGSPNRPF